MSFLTINGKRNKGYLIDGSVKELENSLKNNRSYTVGPTAETKCKIEQIRRG